jgi:DNA-binding transcriptional regulator LsrR (DeoR family)|tara:strand:- start:2647 stop:2916 length:270 start_codon:yes stop_codon:yes gene_type:complete
VARGKYIIVPAEVRYNKQLAAGAKLLFGDLAVLAKNKGYVFATNGYIAKTIGCTEITVSNWISQLKKSGHVSIKYNPHRQIYVKSYSKS